MKKKILILSAIVGLFTASCADWLDVVPKTMEPADVMFDTYQGYKDALTGCYVKMKDRAVWGEHMTMTTVEYLAQHWKFGNTPPLSLLTDDTAIKKYDYEDDHVKGVFQNMYSGLYNIIVQANTILEAMPKTGETAIVDPHARGVVEGEAYAIRALCHFEILRLFGQVPKNATLAPISLPYTTTVSREPIGYIDYDQLFFSGEAPDEKPVNALFWGMMASLVVFTEKGLYQGARPSSRLSFPIAPAGTSISKVTKLSTMSPVWAAFDDGNGQFLYYGSGGTQTPLSSTNDYSPTDIDCRALFMGTDNNADYGSGRGWAILEDNTTPSTDIYTA